MAEEENTSPCSGSEGARGSLRGTEGEGDVLPVPRSRHDEEPKTPTGKSLPVRIRI